VGKSVSRVGGKAQLAAFRAVAGDLKLAYAQFEELETFARFGAHLDDDTQASITHGQRIRACLQQPELAPVPVPAQLAIVLSLTAGLFDSVPMDRMAQAEQAVIDAAGSQIADALGQRLLQSDQLSDEDRVAMVALVRGALAAFVLAPDPPPAA
jgi:F-type H+-transporting ATPase subunit alpha